MQSARIVFIDYLKVIGLLCIILAHVCTNPVIFQIRSFDVPLMVIVSGFLAIDSYKRSVSGGNSLLDYYWKRFSRLVLPTWIFLAFYFCADYLLGNFPYGFWEVLRSFLLLDGIGYVWIIRVYLICAFLTPVIYHFNEKIKSLKIKVLILLAIYISYEVFVFFGFNELNFIFSYVIAYAVPYGVIYILGMFSKNTSWKGDLKMSTLFLAVFIISGIGVYFAYGGIQPTQIMKYPPTVYFISYGLFASFLLMGFFKRVNPKASELVEFASRSSLWIYLWHIMFLSVVPVIFSNWMVAYVIVVVCAVLVTYIQNRFVDILERRNVNMGLLKLFRG